MTITPEGQAYQNGRDDMRERVLDKLGEELTHLRTSNTPNADQLCKLLEHVIGRVEGLT